MVGKRESPLVELLEALIVESPSASFSSAASALPALPLPCLPLPLAFCSDEAAVCFPELDTGTVGFALSCCGSETVFASKLSELDPDADAEAACNCASFSACGEYSPRNTSVQSVSAFVKR